MVNAFITVTAEQATADAQRAEAEIMKGRWRGRLHGIPVGLKDLFDTAGVRTTGGSAQFAERVPADDAEATAAQSGGRSDLGKQNLHEFGLGATSAASHFGPVRNPWNREYVAEAHPADRRRPSRPRSVTARSAPTPGDRRDCPRPSAAPWG